jgi:hypothetical protein
MKRHGLLIVTGLTVGLTAMLLMNAQAPPGRAHRSSLPRQRESTALATLPDPTTDPAAQRWLRGEARHWRDWVLRH